LTGLVQLQRKQTLPLLVGAGLHSTEVVTRNYGLRVDV
jgi:hypothetical protein